MPCLFWDVHSPHPVRCTDSVVPFTLFTSCLLVLAVSQWYGFHLQMRNCSWVYGKICGCMILSAVCRYRPIIAKKTKSDFFSDNFIFFHSRCKFEVSVTLISDILQCTFPNQLRLPFNNGSVALGVGRLPLMKISSLTFPVDHSLSQVGGQ